MAAILPVLLLVAGCGMQGAPQPPTLKLPQPVTDLSGTRQGDEVSLHWTMPKRDTDKVILKGEQRVHVCRRLENGDCESAGDLMLAPATAAGYVDHLPARLTAGSPQLLVYTLLLQNHLGHDAGPSNLVYTATGAAPPKIEKLSAEVSADGVILRWTAVTDADSARELIRIHRSLVVDAKARKPDQAVGQTVPENRTLEVTGPDKGQALDRDAALDHVYRYTVERVVRLALQGHSFEESSAPSDTVAVDARDVFPPQVPTGLQAVADPDAHAIDLSWTPDSDADIAGYVVYRREPVSSASPVRVSPPGLVAPSFRDSSALPGHNYAYSVSAVDRDGNESARSADVEEGLPQP